MLGRGFQDQKLNQYKAMVRPRLTYGAPLWWGHGAKTNVSLIERVETKILKTIATLRQESITT